MDTLLLATDEDAKQVPNMELAQLLFSYSHHLTTNQERSNSLKEQILEVVTKESMAPLYKHITAKMNWEFDESLYATMK